MNKEHDDYVNDLIKYYDSNDSLSDYDSDDSVPTTVPPEETFGDTVIVNVKKKPMSFNDDSDAEKTRAVRINSADTLQNDGAADSTRAVNIPQAAECIAPIDEVLGNLDLQGRIIENPVPQSPGRETQPRAQRTTDKPIQSYNSGGEEPMRRNRGVWYTLKPLWVTMIACVLIVCSYLFTVTDTGIIGTYKRNFSYNMSLILRVFGIEYDSYGDMPIVGSTFGITAHAEGDDEDDRPIYRDIKGIKATIPFKGADNAKFEKYDNGVVCASSNYVCYINQSGKKKWENDTTISDPLISAAGKYVAVAAKDNTQLNLYKNGEQVFAIDIPNNIKSCSVSENGDIALVTYKTAYKGAVSVINRKGEEIFSWISGVNYITSASMMKNRSVAVSLVNTENGVKSYIMLFDVYSEDPLGGTEIADSLIYKSSSRKKNTYAAGDNMIACINSEGESKYIIHFDDMEITHTACGKKGWSAVFYTDNYIPRINVYKPNGDLYSSAAGECTPEYTDIYKQYVLYNNGRDVICGKINGIKTKYSVPMAVKNLIMLSKDTYMIAYADSLEIIKI